MINSVSARICVRRDTTAIWNSHRSLIPFRGEVIVYTDHMQYQDEQGRTVTVPGIKIGDGRSYLIDLPFVTDGVANQILAELREHTEDEEIHVQGYQKYFWNNKLNCRVQGSNLIFNRD